MSIPELIEQLQELASLPEAKNMKVQFYDHVQNKVREASTVTFYERKDGGWWAAVSG